MKKHHHALGRFALLWEGSLFDLSPEVLPYVHSGSCTATTTTLIIITLLLIIC